MRMRQQKNRYDRFLSVLCFSLVLSMLPLMNAEANTGRVSYGSESYEWEQGTVEPIGVYVIGDETVADYEVCLTYDASMLRYIDGATEYTGEYLYIRGSGDAGRYKTMLLFEPLKPGDTQIKVVSAIAHTTPKTVSGNGEAVTQDFILDLSMSVAPITITGPESSNLSELIVESYGLENFAPEVLEYTLQVPGDVESLNISYTPEDGRATVTVSDPVLQVGENTITIDVESGDEQSQYVLHVYREEPVATAVPTMEPTPEPTIEPAEPTAAPTPAPKLEETVIGSWIMKQKEPIKVLVLGAGCLLVLVLAIINAIQEWKRRSYENEQSETKNQIKVVDLEQTVIRVKDVTMRFKMAKDEASSLKEYLIRAIKKQNHYSYLTALNHVSFEIKQGDVVGIIGTNGSGKSTILKIVSGALVPTHGKVVVDRSKVQMLTLGTGFDMELTARENVYLNGSIIGYTREYIDEKYDDIVKFAELEGFMEERMKNFSSGMVSRLGFAIATMRDTPDILILDEVLSVGDMFFREKSEKRIKEMIHSGATVLIVSHSMDTIRKNCNKVVWIEKGELQMVGDPQTVCEAYCKMDMQK